MSVDVDLSQYCDVILLWNAVAMFLISFCTDYWEYRNYDYSALVDVFARANQTVVRDYDNLYWRHSMVLEFCVGRSCRRGNDIDDHDDDDDDKNVAIFEMTVPERDLLPEPVTPTKFQTSTTTIYRYYLFTEYGNLFKECNELEVTETFSLLFGCFSLVMMVAAMFNGTVGAVRNQQKMIMAAGICLAGQGSFYLLTVCLFAAKLHFVKLYYATRSIVWQHEATINSHRRFSLGWSYMAAILSLILTAVASYVFLANGKAIRRRRTRHLRRQRMEVALMSSCKQDVALALRAKMIVITPEKDNLIELW